jgi:lysophospholipase L1-like esterase
MRSTTIGLFAAALAIGGLTVATPAASAADDRPTAIVSLGDSAISGEGAGNYEPGTRGENGNWCHRSANALVHRTTVANRTINLACSGADSANVSLPTRPTTRRAPRPVA